MKAFGLGNSKATTGALLSFWRAVSGPPRRLALILMAMLCLGDLTWRRVPTANDWSAVLRDFPIPVRSAWRQWKLSQLEKDGRLVRLYWLRLLYRWLNALDLAVLRARLSVWRWLIRNRG